MRFRIRCVAAALCGVGLATSALAQSAGPNQPPPPPAMSAPMDAICTDRPNKTNYACTVGEGHFQYEADIFNSTFQHLDGLTTDTTLILNPTIKYGVSRDIDVEASLALLDIVRTHEAGSPTSQTLAGPGDLYLRVKYEFLDPPGGAVQATLLPYVKLPTARPGIGDGAVEEGLIVPINVKLGGPFSLTLDPEIDALKDQVGGGRHPNTAELINLGMDLGKKVTLYGELWGDWNFDPRGLVRQYSADSALAWGLSERLQLDIGVNVGLNRYTPGAQVYLGVSQKF